MTFRSPKVIGVHMHGSIDNIQFLNSRQLKLESRVVSCTQGLTGRKMLNFHTIPVVNVLVRGEPVRIS